MNTDPRGASIALAYPTIDGGWHVDLVAYESGESSLWIADEMERLTKSLGPVAIGTAGGGPARAIMPRVKAFADARLIPFRSMTMQDLGAASGLFYDGLRTGTLSHGDSPALDTAVNGARTKDSSALWRFDRDASRVDVSPLIAASVAVFIGTEAQATQRKPSIH